MDATENKDTGQTSAPGLFPNTRWTMVRRAQADSQTALGSLFESYREPLLIWLRIKAYKYAPLEPEDLVQGFCAHLLSRQFMANVQQEKGKFRTFLLTALQRYAKDEHEKWRAGKRGGGQTPASLQETDDQGQPLHDPAGSGTAPDLDFDRAWAQTILANALRQLETECARSGHAALCTALEPVMFADETASPYREIGKRLGMSEGAVKTAASRIRARLKGIVREEILQTVDNEEDLRDELHYLASLFGN
jgi:RNA polymerase sigma-70 factor (ECF subfamily)